MEDQLERYALLLIGLVTALTTLFSFSVGYSIASGKQAQEIDRSLYALEMCVGQMSRTMKVVEKADSAVVVLLRQMNATVAEMVDG